MEGARKVPDEVRSILAEVCAEYRVRIDPDDPVMAVVMLNRLVLELALNRAVERIEAATAALNSKVDGAQVRMGAVLAHEMRSALQNTGRGASRSGSGPSGWCPNIATVSAIALAAFCVGLCVGILLR